MPGTSRHTGQRLSAREHLYQSVRDILTTPIGSRVGRRSYGCRLSDLIDTPINPRSLADVTEAAADALRKWEPRFTLQRVQFEGAAADGRLSLRLEGILQGEQITLGGVAL